MAAAGCKRENALVETNDASERGVGEREMQKVIYYAPESGEDD